MIAVTLLALAVAQAPAAASPSPAATPRPAPSGPVVVLETSHGTIKLALDKEKAPLTVDNFLKYVRARHYDGTVFHRVMPGFMIQGGGMDPQLVEKKTLPPVRN